VADLLLYDRLVVPVPSPEDVARWEDEQHWDPKRQTRLLNILGGFAEPTVWDAPLREQFEHEWSPGDAVLDIGGIQDRIASRQDPYELTRRMISRQLCGKIVEEDDVRAVAVYAKPDSFNREWKLTQTLPFVRRATRVEPGVLREAVDALSAEGQRLAKVVVTRLVVPDEGRSDEEVLERTVALVSRDDVS